MYDPDELLVEVTDREDRVTEYFYDEDDRLVLERWRESDADVDAIEFAYTYDAAGRLHIVRQRLRKYATYECLQYDQQYDPNTPLGVDITYTYDAFQNTLTTVWDYADLELDDDNPDVDVVITTDWDGYGFLYGETATVAGRDDYSNTYRYDEMGRPRVVVQTGGGGREYRHAQAGGVLVYRRLLPCGDRPVSVRDRRR